jgi:hypothetical protein
VKNATTGGSATVEWDLAQVFTDDFPGRLDYECLTTELGKAESGDLDPLWKYSGEFREGVTQVSCRSRDAAGNVSKACEFTVTIEGGVLCWLHYYCTDPCVRRWVDMLLCILPIGTATDIYVMLYKVCRVCSLVSVMSQKDCFTTTCPAGVPFLSLAVCVWGTKATDVEHATCRLSCQSMQYSADSRSASYTASHTT